MARELRYARPIAIDLIYVVLVAVGVLLLVVPGVLAFVLLGLAGPAVELEDRSVRGALVRSFRLVRTDFWLVLSALVAGQDAARSGGMTFAVVNPSVGIVRRVLEVTGLFGFSSRA